MNGEESYLRWLDRAALARECSERRLEAILLEIGGAARVFRADVQGVTHERR